MLEYPIQKTETSTCGPFQIYFYDNLFFPDENSKLNSFKKLTKEMAVTLLNKIFSLDRKQNKEIINEYITEKNIKMTKRRVTKTQSDCPVQIINLSLSKIDGFGQVRPL